MGNLAVWLAVIAVAWAVAAGVWTWRLRGAVARGDMLCYAVAMIVSSVCIFGLGSLATEVAHHSMLSYATGMFKVALGGQEITEATASQIQGAAQWVAVRADNSYMVRLVLAQAAGAVLKYFVPAIMAALGVWALEKCMERRVRVA